MDTQELFAKDIALERLTPRFSACKLSAWRETEGMAFYARACGELSLLCETAHVPDGCIAREDGWRGLRVCGPLDFSLVGILNGLTAALAKNRIPVMAISTYDTDYLFVKEDLLDDAVRALRAAGYEVAEANPSFKENA